jgi:uncharacterized protein YsxB (DUF464 family)
VGEAIIHRDDRGRIVGLTLRDVGQATIAGTSAGHFVRAASAALSEYLHVPVAADHEMEGDVTIDRSDTHLDREIDAVLETLVIGLRMLEQEYPTDLVVQEATVGIEV